ncbi:MAG: FMN-binding protein [Synergistaceae bacterium]|jgi:major membrane immunogen (membrane-anchored lipoprotein)|nr:FMN-binding protein [Synergistaceae bacterium]
MKTLYAVFVLMVALLASVAYKFSPTDSQNALQNGYYTAETADYNYGWKEFITIYVRNGRIVTAEYNARNASGFMKSWDMEYMRVMNRSDSNYPNKYTRTYVSELLRRQSAEGIDAMSGATESFHSFKLLVEAVLAQAKTGDKKVAFVAVTGEAR